MLGELRKRSAASLSDLSERRPELRLGTRVRRGAVPGVQLLDSLVQLRRALRRWAEVGADAGVVWK